MLMEEVGTKPQDYDFAVFHQPNGKFPRRAAHMLGFTAAQYEPGIIFEHIGNTYSAATLLGLINILEQAKAGQKILLTSYGSGAGSDSFHIEVQDGIEDVTTAAPLLQSFIQRQRKIDYGQYLLQTGAVR